MSVVSGSRGLAAASVASGGATDAAPSSGEPVQGSGRGGDVDVSIRPQALRLGAGGYLNARPLVYGLGGSPGFDIRFDVPLVGAALLQDGGIDLGLIPSVEY